VGVVGVLFGFGVGSSGLFLFLGFVGFSVSRGGGWLDWLHEFCLVELSFRFEESRILCGFVFWWRW